MDDSRQIATTKSPNLRDLHNRAQRALACKAREADRQTDRTRQTRREIDGWIHSKGLQKPR